MRILEANLFARREWEGENLRDPKETPSVKNKGKEETKSCCEEPARTRRSSAAKYGEKKGSDRDSEREKERVIATARRERTASV